MSLSLSRSLLQTFTGNRPSLSILLPALTPYTVGQVGALLVAWEPTPYTPSSVDDSSSVLIRPCCGSHGAHQCCFSHVLVV